MKRAPRLYTDWRRPSRERNRRLLLLALMIALTGLALFVFDRALPPVWPEIW